jgi:SAM-dependent methyltransferase
VGLTDLFSRRRKDGVDGAPSAGSEQPTKALPRFLAGLVARPQALLLDLGPVVGPNVNFFGEELGCKIFVEDLSADIDRHVRENRLEELPAFLARRFPQATATVDGILCWDVFDYLPRPAAQALAQQLARVLRPEGVLLAFFSTVAPPADARPTYTRYIVIDRTRIEHRPYAAARGKQRPLQNRDIERLFEPLRVAEQFLLKTNMREVLLRKPADTAPGPDPARG